MAKAVRHEDVASGMWRFSRNVTVETVIALAEEWREAGDGKNYLFLHVRPGPREEKILVFVYRLNEGKDHKKFVYKMSDALKRRFGNDLLGWDISNPTWIVA